MLAKPERSDQFYFVDVGDEEDAGATLDERLKTILD